MKSIGVVICNYNKKDYVLQCIQAVLESTIKDYDIYVVDNASTDGSAQAIQEQYGSAVTVICNETNLGGSGGFNTGIRLVAEKGYSYICCLDNDALLDENALVEMRDFLQENKKVGMVGAKIFHMHDPSRIQQYGLKIDFEKYQTSSYYFDEIENETIPQIMYCDTVPACAVMLPLEVVKEVGVMPEDNFIYWDDTEWGYLVKQAGYQVAAIASAKALHEMGSLQKKSNTFTQYYMWRNRIHFFLKYTPASNAEQMSISLLSAVFQEIFEAMYNGEHNISQTIIMAYKDALEGVRGKAKVGRILESDGNHTALREFFAQFHTAEVLGDADWVRAVFGVLSIPVIVNDDTNLPDIKIQTCESVLYLTELEPDIVYLDQNLCMLANEQDAELISHFQFGLGMFLYMNQRSFLEAIERISEK
jgi:GT2 family glycosyltransferase